MKRREELISIDKDVNFEDKQNLLDLKSAMDAMRRAEEMLATYSEQFARSFLKTTDEVLTYIPEEDYDKYRLCSGYLDIFNGPWHIGLVPDHNGEIQRDGQRFRFETNEEAEQRCNVSKQPDLASKLRAIEPSLPVFLVDTVARAIEVFWDGMEPSHYGLLGIMQGNSGSLMYSADSVPTIEGNVATICCRASYEYSYSRPAHNAVLISGRYYNKVTYHKSYDHVELEHLFCMRTNRYMGVHRGSSIFETIKNSKSAIRMRDGQFIGR